MNEEWIVVADSLTSVEANLLKVHLQDEGIEARLDEDAAGSIWAMPSLIGVKVLVRHGDRERAAELIEIHPKVDIDPAEVNDIGEN